MSVQSLAILGSTGTIGVNTLDVVRRNQSRFSIHALVGHTNIELLFKQCCEFLPKVAVVCDDSAFAQWREQNLSERFFQKTGQKLEVLGQAELEAVCVAPEVNTVVAAIVGAAGLFPTLASLKAGKRVLLANKESLVLAGRFMIDACIANGATLLPIDSEHNAIYQCLPPDYDLSQPDSHGVEKLVLTASGGPFRTADPASLVSVTPEQAVAHPNWKMGRKISVDSATMANKSLELIEALWLFGLKASQLDVLIHPQSIVHSMVEYSDGSVLAQMGCPDMRTPIAHVLGLPDRIESGSAKLDLAAIGQLNFEAPDLNRFPMLKLAKQVLEHPDVLAPIFNAANEVAVDAFLNSRIGYTEIYNLVGRCMDHFSDSVVQCLDSTFELDQQVRKFAHNSVISTIQ